MNQKLQSFQQHQRYLLICLEQAEQSNKTSKRLPRPKKTHQSQISTQPVEAKATLTDFLPSPQQVTTTASIAVVATSAALAKPLADLLLKLVKPAVKKAQKKLFGVFGKKTKVESVRESVLPSGIGIVRFSS